jgi:hypothetical protein
MPANETSDLAGTGSSESQLPRWLHVVMTSDAIGTACYLGASFLFAPALIVLSPWPALTTIAWWIIGAAGLCLGLLGIALAAGLARILWSGEEIPEDYWHSMIHHGRSSHHRRDHTQRYRDGS